MGIGLQVGDSLLPVCCQDVLVLSVQALVYVGPGSSVELGGSIAGVRKLERRGQFVVRRERWLGRSWKTVEKVGLTAALAPRREKVSDVVQKQGHARPLDHIGIKMHRDGRTVVTAVRGIINDILAARSLRMTRRGWIVRIHDFQRYAIERVLLQREQLVEVIEASAQTISASG